MPIIATFQLTEYAIPYYPDFVEKNANNLKNKITFLCPYLSNDLIFASFIEILPGISYYSCYHDSSFRFKTNKYCSTTISSS